MSIIVLGLNHRTAPVELREQLAFSREGAAAALMLFKELHPTAEAAILSTCNRVEIIAAAENLSETDLVAFLSRARNIPAAAFSKYLYQVADGHAIRHVFRVISGLDSMVLGEFQIVNQLKSAYEMAHEQNTAGPILHRLFHHAFGVSKRVRTETNLGEGKTSMSSTAVDLIRQSAKTLDNQRILIIGAGDVAQLTVQHLKAANARQIVITTRTLQNSRLLADACGGEAVPFTELDEELPLADVVITCTACRTSILTASRVRSAMLKRCQTPQLLIDLSVPRNIDAEVAAIPNVTLIDVDALGNMVEQVRRQRVAAVENSEEIVQEEVAAFERWLAESKVAPLIQQMFSDVRALAEIEVRATFRKCPDFSETQREAIEQLADRLVAKLMHPCVSTLRQSRASEPAQMLVNAFHSTRLNVVSAT
ncbi:MAG TPA: glutamyl-tRNA reductase [Phycisphaerae bacterium]|nr:glutamyl-tRNA reductase [Phycisphaerae bacterium]